jgi:small-conductance mechanosensitive channel
MASVWFRSVSRVCLFLLLLVPPLTAVAQPEAASAPDGEAGEATPSEEASGADPDPDQPDAQGDSSREAIRGTPFDPALVGLPELPQPMQTAGDFQAALDLIDARIAEKQAALEAAEAAVAERQAVLDAAAADAEEQIDATGGSEDGTGVEIDADAEPGAATGSDTEAAVTAKTDRDLQTLEAAASTIARQIEVLQELRVTVQRRATLAGRLREINTELASQRERLDALERDGVSLEPPYLVSLLDQARAELALDKALEEVAETRIETAMRRRDAAERGLTTAVRERRAARDRLSAGEDLSRAQREAREQALELARLNELRARQQLAAAESALEKARSEDSLAEAEQAMLQTRISFLEERVELPREALEQRLEELAAAEEAMRAQIEALELTGDQAEAALYQARQNLDEAGPDADRATLEEWVQTRQAELQAARSSVDSLLAAIANLTQIRSLWEQRYQIMTQPDAVDLTGLLQQVITGAAAARAEKDDLEQRLNSLRAIQLAQTRRLRDSSLSEGVREAMAVRSRAQDLAERYGRELLETQDQLIALLDGMRSQLEPMVQEQTLSLQLLQAQEALANWWDAELIVIDDQSIRARELATALVMFIVVLVAVSLVRMGARRALNRRKAKNPTANYGDLRLALSAVAGNTNQLFVLIAAFYVAMTVSGLASPTVQSWLWTALVIAFYAQLGIWANAAMVDYFNRRRTRQEMRDPSTVTGYGLLTFFLRVGIWITVVVSLLAYFQYPVAGLVGALGVGSLAIAFAVQNILGDVFSSMAIILDKPFRVGDFVKAGETLGTIEHIGVKTTRIRSLSGEQVVTSNSDLLNSRIHNYKHFRERRIAFRIGVVYQTPRELLERIPGMLREAVEEQPNARFDRAHFVEYGDFALIFEIVYYVLSPDYTLYMDIQQGINLGIHRRFEQAGVSFAYPTQELILRRGPAQTVASEAASAGG